MKNSKVIIVLATYNGQKYLREQIESIQAQTFTDWSLLVRDDCSTDLTPNILEGYARSDRRITIVDNNNINLGVIHNFGELLTIADSFDNMNYVFFSDQDDVWKPEKLKSMIEQFKKSEKQYGQDLPLLVHSDLEVVNEELELINPSFMKFQSIANEKYNPWQILCVQNYVTGCVMGVNKPLLRFSLPIPKNVMMHDWWLALVASIYGRIEFVDEPLIKYRQHLNNQVGAKGFWMRLNPFNRDLWDRWKRGSSDLLLCTQQIKSMLERMEVDNVDNSLIMTLEEFANILTYSRVKRLRVMFKHKIRRQNKLMTSLLYLRVILM